MPKILSPLVSVLLVSLLAGCSSDSQLVGQYRSDWSFCTTGNQDSQVYCEVAFLSENPSSSIVTLSDQGAYLVVDGLVYVAETRNRLASTTWNPGEKLQGFSGFSIPEGALIEKFFYSPTQNIQDATLVISVNAPAKITQ